MTALAPSLMPAARPADCGPGLATWLQWVPHLILLVFIVSQVTAGVLRWALGLYGLQALIYVPTLLLWVQIVSVVARSVHDAALSRAALLLYCLLCTSVLVGALSLPLKQVLFGAWVLTPLLYGYAAASLLKFDHPSYRLAAVAVLVIASVGIIVNAYTSYPWVGANFQLAGKEIAGAREWHIGERQRLAGLSRSSFDAAGQIVVLAALFVVNEKRLWLRGAVWVLAASAVMLSTARGIMLAMLVTMVMVECEHLRWRFATRALTAVGLLWISLPPLIGWSIDLSQTARLQMHAAWGSYLDRMSNMWPSALQLLLDSPCALLGRGIGGIGAAQTLFEPDRFNAADNLFVYQLVVLGAMALPLLAIVAYGIWKTASGPDAAHGPFRAFGLIVLWYGAVSNIVEHPVLALLYGLLLQRSFAALRPVRSH
jgi:hypothetical protein